MTNRLQVVAVAVAVALAGLTGCSGDTATPDPEPTTSPTPTPTSSTAVPLGVPQETTAKAVADLLDQAIADATTATVSIEIAGEVGLDGTADYTADPPSLVGTLDFRQSDAIADYAARDLEVVTDLPDGVDFPDDPPAPRSNPWGYPMLRVDPVTLVLAFRQYGVDASERHLSTGSSVYAVRLDGTRLLVALGYEESALMPTTVKYAVGVDGDGRLSEITGDYDQYGSVSVDFTGWR